MLDFLKEETSIKGISSISQNLPGWLRGVVLPVILVLGVLAADVAFFRLAKPSPSSDSEISEEDLFANFEAGALLGTAGPVEEIDHDDTYSDFAGFVLVEKSSLIGEGGSLGNGYSEEDVLTYTVRDGDTLSSIAKTFGISVGDILEANDKGSSLIRPGEELAIVPVSKSGSPAVARGGSAEAVAKNTYFIRPVDGGLNWGVLHDVKYMPAVDISKACGSDIYAAAPGTVVQVGNPERYNSGYGGYVIIVHQNGTRTLYAHNAENLIEVGDEVLQGGRIGRVGSTGLTHGTTGCHVHFGVSGAENPFVR